MAESSHKYQYEAVTGYFLQDDPKTDPDSFEYVSLLLIPLLTASLI